MTIQDIIASGRATLTIKETAELLGCDPRTVSRGCAAGTIENFPVGSRRFIPVAPLLKLFGIEFGGETNGS